MGNNVVNYGQLLTANLRGMDNWNCLRNFIAIGIGGNDRCKSQS